MKKLIAIALVAAFCMVSFVGCTTGKTTMKDGTYRAEFATEDKHGWYDFVEITVAGDKITKVVYDSLKDGLLKSEDEDYEINMRRVNDDQTWPTDFFEKLTTQLVEKQNIDEVDTVAGATTSSNDFKTLVKALSKNMEKGNTETLKVDRTDKE